MADPTGPMGGMPGATAPAHPEADGYFDRLLKYIPTEIVTLYAGLAVMVDTAEPDRVILSWSLFFILLALTPIHLLYLGVEQRRQLILSTACFVVWALALGYGPFADIDRMIGAVVLPIFSFTLPYWEWRPAV